MPVLVVQGGGPVRDAAGGAGRRSCQGPAALVGAEGLRSAVGLAVAHDQAAGRLAAVGGPVWITIAAMRSRRRQRAASGLAVASQTQIGPSTTSRA